MPTKILMPKRRHNGVAFAKERWRERRPSLRRHNRRRETVTVAFEEAGWKPAKTNLLGRIFQRIRHAFKRD